MTNYSWNFTVGAQEIHLYTVKTQYIFNEVGLYLITLNVTSMSGMTDEASVVVNVTSDPIDNPPVANAGGDVYGDTSDVPCWLYGRDSMDDFGITNYTWTFFDGPNTMTLYGEFILYYFEYAGTYRIELTVTDTKGQTDTDNATAFVEQTTYDMSPPIAEAGPDQTVNAGDLVVLDASASTDNVGIVAYKWFLFDGVTLTFYDMEATHTFHDPGDYAVFLQVWDAAYNTAEDTLTVHVIGSANELPVADAGENATIRPGTTFVFNASGSTDDAPGLQYLWTFTYNGTREIMFGISPQFIFKIPGTYTVTLTVTDTHGLSDQDTIIVRVRDDTNVGLSSAQQLILAAGAAGAAAVLIAGYMLESRRRKPRSPRD
jgi:PKD repeat protein